MPAIHSKAANLCYYPGCESSYARKNELIRHWRVHDIYEGRLNPYVCETCNRFFSRKDVLNKHREDHGSITKLKKPVIAAEFCGSYKIFHSKVLVNRRKTINILEYLGMENQVGFYRANFINHKPTVENGVVTGWKLTPAGTEFKVQSLRFIII